MNNYSLYDDSQHAQGDQFFTLKDLMTSLWRGRWIVLGSLVVALACAFVYLALAKPVYTASARILIDPRQIDPLQTSTDGRGYSDLLVIDSQIEIMRSRGLAERAMEELKLFDEPRAADESLVSAIGQWLGALVGSEEQIAADAERERQERINTFKKRISIERVRLTYAIEISFRHRDPQFAARAANAMANAYLEDQLQSQFSSVSRSRQWIDQQLVELRANVLKAEQAVAAFRAEHNLVTTGKQTDLSDQQLSELNSQLILARANTAEAKARMDRMDAIIASGDPNQAVSDVLSSRLISDLRQQYGELSQYAAEIEAKHGAQHQIYKDTIEDLQRIRERILQEVERIGRSYRNEYEISLARELALARQLAAEQSEVALNSEASVQLAELERQATSARATYENLLDSSNTLAQKETVPITEARIIDQADPPTNPASPQKRTIVIVAAALGLLAGMGLVIVRTMMDERIWTQGELEKLTMRQSLGVVPRLNLPSTQSGTPIFSAVRMKLGISAKLGDRIPSLLLQPFIRALSASFSPQVEVMRSINMYLGSYLKRDGGKVVAPPQGGAHVISFCSLLPGEGKTSLGLLYATYLAQNGAKVLLIDLDYRRPGLTRLLAPNARAGIFDIPELTGSEADVADSPQGQEEGVEPLRDADDVCMAGMDGMLRLLPGRTASSSTMLIEEKLEIILERLIDQYRGEVRTIIVDLPPVLSLPDAAVLARHLDAIFLVTEWGRTEKSVIKMGMGHSPEFFGRLSGTILNKARVDVLQSYGKSESARTGYYS